MATEKDLLDDLKNLVAMRVFLDKSDELKGDGYTLAANARILKFFNTLTEYIDLRIKTLTKDK